MSLSEWGKMDVEERNERLLPLAKVVAIVATIAVISHFAGGWQSGKSYPEILTAPLGTVARTCPDEKCPTIDIGGKEVFDHGEVGDWHQFSIGRYGKNAYVRKADLK